MATPTEKQGQHDGLEGAAYRELRLLEEVEDTPEVSQRGLALRLGIALGVANLLLRNLIRKGYIRATRVGCRRWVYALTPAGFSRKAQLTFSYVERFRDHYKRVRMLLRDDLGDLATDPRSRIAIYGSTELAELMYLALRDLGLTSIDVFDGDGPKGDFLGSPVKTLGSIVPADYAKVIVAFPSDIDARTEELAGAGVARDRIVTPLYSQDSAEDATDE